MNWKNISVTPCRLWLTGFCVFMASSGWAVPLTQNGKVLIVGTAAEIHGPALQSLIDQHPGVNGLGVQVDHLATSDLLDFYYENWAESRTRFPSNTLFNALDQDYDVVILHPREEVIRAFPELHYEVVRMIKLYVQPYGSEVMTVMPAIGLTPVRHANGYWELFSDSTSVEAVTYRISDAHSVGCVPVGLAWRSILNDPSLSASEAPLNAPNTFAVNTYITTLFAQLFGQSASSSTYRHGSISASDFQAVVQHADQAIPAGANDVHYTGDHYGAFSAPPSKFDPEVHDWGQSGASSEAFTTRGIIDIIERKGLTPQPDNTKVNLFDYTGFHFFRGQHYGDHPLTRGDSTTIRFGQTYKRNNYYEYIPYVSYSSLRYYMRPSPYDFNVPNYIAFARMWQDHPQVQLKSDGHLTYAGYMLQSSLIYTIVTQGDHPLADVTDLESWTGPERYAAGLGYATIMGMGRLSTTDGMAPVATQVPRLYVDKDTVNPIELTGHDFSNLPIHAEIITPPEFGSIDSTPGGWTYTPDPGFTGIDYVTYRISNGSETSLPLRVQLVVEHVEIAFDPDALFTEDFEDRDVSDWDWNGAYTSGSLTFYDPYDPSYMGYYLQQVDGQAALALNSASVEKGISTVGYQNIVLKIRVGLKDMWENDLSAFASEVEWFDGQTWHPLIEFTPTWREHSLLFSQEVALPAGAANNPDFRIRLNGRINSNRSYAVFDSIELTGDELPLPPVATGASYLLDMNTQLDLTLQGSDPNSADVLSYHVVDAPDHGTLSSGTSSQRTYTPTPGFTGIDTFTFRANDGVLNSNTATITIDVRDNQAPVVDLGLDRLLAANEGSGSLVIPLSGSVSDPNGDTLSYVWSLVSGVDTVSIDDPAAASTSATVGSTGSYTFRLVADDGLAVGSDEVTFTVTSVADTDGDGLDDSWELTYFGDLDEDGTGDPDLDNENNATEFANGTNPTVNLPPAPPQNPDATDENKMVLLDWEDSPESDFHRYRVYRSTTMGSGHVEIAAGLSHSEYADKTVTNGTEYYYVITAVDEQGNESAFSAEVSATPQVQPASAVALYTFDNTSMASSDTDPNSTASVLSEGGGLAAAITDEADPRLGWLIGMINDTTVLDDDYVSFTVTPVPGATLSFAALSLTYWQNTSQGGILHVFSSQNGFADVADAISIETTPGKTTATVTVDLSGMSATTEATEFRIYFRTGAGASGYLCRMDTLQVTATTELVVETPQPAGSLQAVSSGPASIDLSWTDQSDNETGFIVQRSLSSGSGFSTIATTLPEVTSFTDTGLAQGTTYFYQVIASNGGLNSAPSNQASASTGSLTPEQQYLVDNGLPASTPMDTDSDGDGMSNEEEFIVQTNPNDGSSRFLIRLEMSNGQTRLSSPVDMVSGRYYRISWRASLTGGDWEAVTGHEGFTPHNGAPLNESLSSPGFYRVEASTTPFSP